MNRIYLLTLLPAVLLAGLSSAAHGETRSPEIPAFTAASFGSALNVKIAVGGPQSVSMSASNQADLDDLRFEVRDGKLRVWRERDIWDFLSFRDARVSLTITVPTLTALEAMAATEVEATGLVGDDLKLAVSSASTIIAKGIDARSVTIDASSAGRLFVDGSCEVIHAAVSSGAVVGGGKLECVDADLEGSSGSQSAFFTSGRVKADVSSGAAISLAGHPSYVDDDETSGGNVDILD